MSIQEMIDRGDVTAAELQEYLAIDPNGTETNHADDTVIDEYDGIQRMIKSESEQLERFLLIRIDELERRLSKLTTAMEMIERF